ncbi:MAG: DUF4258 domain-containing protein [Firmicutes bacterium]|nr:DUF4258 domain-containing protein [Bacillota bacterium]
MDIDKIRQCVRESRYLYSQHAEHRRKTEGLTFEQIEEALLSGQIIEDYADTGRGESCLIVGFSGSVAIHAVCGRRGDKVVIITVYVPRPPKFVDPWTRGSVSSDEPEKV